MIKKSMVTSIGVATLLSAVLMGGCGAEDGAAASSQRGAPASDAGTGLGACDPLYCPTISGGLPCCVLATNACGVDYGTGCVSTGSTTGGGVVGADAG